MAVSKITTPISDLDQVDKINEIIDNLGGGGSSYTAGTGISINSSNVISVTSPTLTNTATGNNALTIGGTASTLAYSVNIGYSSSIDAASGVAIGTLANSASGIAIGYMASSPYPYCVSLGNHAATSASYAIQLGYGTNSEANSFYVGTSQSNNWKMLGSDGKIPDDRLNTTIARTSGIPTVNNSTITITQGGVTKGSFTLNQASGDTIALDAGGGSVTTDGTTINTNSSDELQAIGVINSRDSSTAIKTWTGTKAQYDAIVTKDANTLYNITDDTDVTLSILEAVYPVGSIYITTANTCPLSTLISGSTWTLVSSGRVLQGADNDHSVGTTIAAGLPNITGSTGFVESSANATGAFYKTSGSGANGYTTTSSSNCVTLDASRSSSIYGNSNTVQPPAYVVNIFERTA